MKIFGRSSINQPTVRSIVRNLVFRRGVEQRPGEWASLFAAVAAMRAHSPHILAALKPLPELGDQHLLTELQHDHLRIYSGLEIIILNGVRYLYYRMPGALPNGEGAVPRGDHRVRLYGIAHPRELFLTVRKEDDGSLSLVEHGLAPTTNAAEYTRLDAGELDYSWIAPELEDLAVRWMQFHRAEIEEGRATVSAEDSFTILDIAARARSSTPRVSDELARLAASLGSKR